MLELNGTFSKETSALKTSKSSTTLALASGSTLLDVTSLSGGVAAVVKRFNWGGLLHTGQQTDDPAATGGIPLSGG